MRRLGVGLALVALLAAGCTTSSAGMATPSQGTLPSSPSTASASLPAVQGAVMDVGHLDDTKQGGNVVLTMEAGDDYFSPTFIKVAPGATITLTITNTGVSQHNFTIIGRPVNVPLNTPGASRTVTFTMPLTGSLTFFCSYHKAVGMQGAFYVR
jgi:plastocyanin